MGSVYILNDFTIGHSATEVRFVDVSVVFLSLVYQVFTLRLCTKFHHSCYHLIKHGMIGL